MYIIPKRIVRNLLRLYCFAIVFAAGLLVAIPWLIARRLDPKKSVQNPMPVPPIEVPQAAVNETFAPIKFFQQWIDKGWKN